MNETLRALQKRAFHFSRNAAAHGKACFCGRFDIGFCEDQCCGGSNEVRRENRFAQRVHGNIADIMVMHAIAPCPTASDVYRLEPLSVHESGYGRCGNMGFRPKCSSRRSTPNWQGGGIMGREIEG